MKAYNIYKPLGKTPLQALESLIKKLNIIVSVSLTYAGRLDPMAEGVLLILANVTDAEKNKILALPKSYEAEVLLGLSTDSFDALGIVKKHKVIEPSKKIIAQILQQYIGQVELPLPIYSSPPVQGKPLHMWARGGNADGIKIPTRVMRITDMQYLGQKKYKAKDLYKKIETKIGKVEGDFRQQKIKKKWRTLLSKDANKYLAIKFTVNCGSGTYIRSLVNDIGKKLNTGATLLSLKRLSVGKYKLANSIKLK